MPRRWSQTSRNLLRANLLTPVEMNVASVHLSVVVWVSIECMFSEDGINGCKHICFCMHEWKGAYKQKCMLKFVDASSKVTKRIKTVLLTGITQHPHFLFLPQLFSTTGSSLNLQGLLRVKGFLPSLGVDNLAASNEKAPSFLADHLTCQVPCSCFDTQLTGPCWW